MASICLYDIDFYHSSGFSPPNLELMKVFNYYYKRGDLVKLGRPQEELSRYNQVIFFKANPNTKIPLKLNLAGENKQIYGYGFFKRFSPLREQFMNETPNYLPYDLEESKIKKPSLYKQIKKGSLIRIENQDFSDFKKDSHNIYVSDYNFLYLDNAHDFISEYSRNYKINFLFPLVAKDQKTFEKFFHIATVSNRRMVVDFKFSSNFFKKYYYESILFTSIPFERELVRGDFLPRILQMILWSKKEKQKLGLTNDSFSKIEVKTHPSLKLWPQIYNWNLSKEEISCYDFISNIFNKNELDNILYNNKRLRLLMKQDPKTFDIENIDFF